VLVLDDAKKWLENTDSKFDVMVMVRKQQATIVVCVCDANIVYVLFWVAGFG